MRKFGLYIIKLILGLIAISVALDMFYTHVYSHSHAKRNRAQQALAMKDGDFDYIILGSSRAVHHINPVVLNEKYNRNGINLAYVASFSNEYYLILKTLIENNNQIDTLFVQIDYTFNSIKPGTLSGTIFMPFIRDKRYKDNYIGFGGKYLLYYYLPFYRYLDNEPNIGVREVIANLLNIERDSEKNMGYVPLNKKKFMGDTSCSYELKDEDNINLRYMQTLCDEHNIHLCFFTAPIYNFTSSNDLLYKYLGDYVDFSRLYNDIELFNDATHLNENGAKEFTDHFGEHYFAKKRHNN